MGSHTLIKKRKDMPRAPLPQCHGGEGTLDWIRILDGEDTVCGHLGFMHDDILPSGTSMVFIATNATKSTIFWSPAKGL